jgi:hypothetical protein
MREYQEISLEDKKKSILQTDKNGICDKNQFKQIVRDQAPSIRTVARLVTPINITDDSLRHMTFRIC